MEVDHPLPVYQPAADISVERAECRVVPGETARFPFVLRTWPEGQSIHDLDVVSANPQFNRSWAHIVESSDGALVRHYTLEIRPTDVRRHHYGTYPLLLTWGAPGTSRYAESRCVLVIAPCVRLTAQPVLAVRPTGQLSLALENCGATGIEVSITLSHHGSNWSRGWEVELGTKDGPFEFSEQFDLPRGAHKGEFEIDISAEGIPVFQTTVRPRWPLVARKHIVWAGVTLAAVALAAVVAALTGGSPAPPLQPQKITFTSVPPAGPVPGGTYAVAANGGGSGQPVTFSIDPPSAAACSVSGSTVTFRQAGSCVIDANEAGNDKYLAAPQAQQAVTVGSLITQAITFPNPGQGFVGQGATLTATGGGSGNQVVFSVDASSGAGVCSVSGTNGSTVSYLTAGTCVIDANQAGGGKYLAAPQAQQAVTVESLITQAITFPNPGPGLVGQGATLTATGGGSGNQVVFSVDASSGAGVCSVSGINGWTVSYLTAGTCVIDANQAGGGKYLAAPQVSQTVTVTGLPQTITFTNPGPGVAGQGATLTATGGGSGNQVVFSVDASSGAGVCSVSGINGSTVSYLAAGTCVIDANQAGGGKYLAAQQAQQTVTVSSPASTSVPQSPAAAGT